MDSWIASSKAIASELVGSIRSARTASALAVSKRPYTEERREREREVRTGGDQTQGESCI